MEWGWKRRVRLGRDAKNTPHTPYRCVRLARFAHVRLVRHALQISLLILRKKPTVLQSILMQTYYDITNLLCTSHLKASDTPPSLPICLRDKQGNAGPFASYLLHFCPPVSWGCAINPGLHLPDRGISGAVTLWLGFFIFAPHSNITVKTAISLQMISIKISYRHISCYVWINSVFLWVLW